MYFTLGTIVTSKNQRMKSWPNCLARWMMIWYETIMMVIKSVSFKNMAQIQQFLVSILKQLQYKSRDSYYMKIVGFMPCF